MKRLFVVLLLIFLSCCSLFAQLAVGIVSDTDPGTLISRLQMLQSMASQVQNAIQQLQEADQMVQYQYMALQQLSAGGWQGFVNAWNQETNTLSTFANLSSQIPALNDSMSMADFMKSWNAASNIVHATDTLIKDSQARQQLWSQTQADSASSQTFVGQMQTVNRALGLLGGEIADVNLNLGAWKQWFVNQQELQQKASEQTQKDIDGYYETDGLDNTGTAIDLSQRDTALATDSW
jgi:hypothetical protein